jgi:hypothetical protein
MDKEPVHFNKLDAHMKRAARRCWGRRLSTELLAEAWLQSIVGVWGTLGMSPEKGL